VPEHTINKYIYLKKSYKALGLLPESCMKFNENLFLNAFEIRSVEAGHFASPWQYATARMCCREMVVGRLLEVK